MRRIVLPGDEGFPFSQAVLDGDLLYVAGQLAADDAGWVGPVSIEAETEAAMRRIGRILDAAGASFADVMRVGVFMVDLGQFEAMNAVYRTFFPIDRLPARTCVGVASLLENALIEIDCVARAPRGAGS